MKKIINKNIFYECEICKKQMVEQYVKKHELSHTCKHDNYKYEMERIFNYEETGYLTVQKKCIDCDIIFERITLNDLDRIEGFAKELFILSKKHGKVFFPSGKNGEPIIG